MRLAERRQGLRRDDGLARVGDAVRREPGEEAQDVVPARLGHGADVFAEPEAFGQQPHEGRLVVQRRVGQPERHQVVDGVDVARAPQGDRQRVRPVHDRGRVGHGDLKEAAEAAEVAVGGLEQVGHVQHAVEARQPTRDAAGYDRVVHRDLERGHADPGREHLAGPGDGRIFRRPAVALGLHELEERDRAHRGRDVPADGQAVEHVDRVAEPVQAMAEGSRVGGHARAARDGQVVAVEADPERRPAARRGHGPAAWEVETGCAPALRLQQQAGRGQGARLPVAERGLATGWQARYEGRGPSAPLFVTTFPPPVCMEPR